jgi:hypothetical protein
METAVSARPVTEAVPGADPTTLKPVEGNPLISK